MSAFPFSESRTDVFAILSSNEQRGSSAITERLAPLSGHAVESGTQLAIEAEISRFLQWEAAGEGAVLVMPPAGPEGFAIEICRDRGRIRCLFGALEEEFETAAAACEWIARALSPSYCLRITVVSGREREWRLEPVEPADAGETLAMGHIAFFDRFRKASTLVKRNTFA